MNVCVCGHQRDQHYYGLLRMDSYCSGSDGCWCEKFIPDVVTAFEEELDHGAKSVSGRTKITAWVVVKPEEQTFLSGIGNDGHAYFHTLNYAIRFSTEEKAEWVAFQIVTTEPKLIGYVTVSQRCFVPGEGTIYS